MEPVKPSVPVIPGQLVPLPTYLMLPSWPPVGTAHVIPSRGFVLFTRSTLHILQWHSKLPALWIPAAFFLVLSTVDFLPFLSLCSNNRRNGHWRIHTGVSSSRRPSWIPPDSFAPNQDSPTPVLRAPLPFVDISLVTYHWIKNIGKAKIWGLPILSSTNAHLFPKKKKLKCWLHTFVNYYSPIMKHLT